MKTNKKRFRVYEVDQDYINFLKGEGRFAYRLKNETDKQVHSHFGLDKENTDKCIGVIIEFDEIKMFAPITHDGNLNWFNRDDTCDIEKIYKNHNYIGSLLLCKAIPVNSVSIHLFKFAKTNNLNKKYTDLCSIELGYLNQHTSTIRLKINYECVLTINHLKYTFESKLWFSLQKFN